MRITATPLTAALAGAFSAIVWPRLWPMFSDAGSSGSVGVVVITLLVIALPAHAFVVGFGRQARAAGGLDTPLLKRIATWLAAAGAIVALGRLAGTL
ncbi:MAG TPA: hypothetical protein PK359_15525 [Burkholderiaceae bacterium]|jgi:hypothetical protein|nr:hypothetical protein [Burkholderiaceae bacterium]